MYFTPGQTVVDDSGDVVGRITDVISDPATLQVEWVTVRTGRLRGEHLLPAEVIRADENGTLTVPFTREHVKHAPTSRDHAAPTRPERDALYGYYGLMVPPQG